MYIDEKHYWNDMYKILFVCILLWFLLDPIDVKQIQFIKEHYSSKKEIIGESKSIRVSNIGAIVPHLGVVLRDHVHTWIVNVPLHPFKSPVFQMPPLEKPAPSFLLYNPSFLSPPRNQGDCGACWAFALCDMLSDRLRITTQGLFDTDLSVQQLLSCDPSQSGCEGGSPEDSCIWLATSGVMLAPNKKIPYRQESGGEIRSTCELNIATSVRVGVVPNSVFSLATFIPENPTTKEDLEILGKNIENMKLQLIQGGPFYCAMTVYEDLFTFDGLSVYTNKKGSPEVGGHAIEIVGYSEKGQDNRKGFEKAYWVCKNSWGSTWPTRSATPGFFMIEMGVNMCGVESRSGVATPSLYGKYAGSTEKKNIKQMRFESFEEYMKS